MSWSATYSVSEDTASAAVDPAHLHREVIAAALGQSIEHVDVAGDVLDIAFADALSGGDRTTLDGVVAAHTGVPEMRPSRVIATDGKVYELAVTAGVGAWTEVT